MTKYSGGFHEHEYQVFSISHYIYNFNLITGQCHSEAEISLSMTTLMTHFENIKDVLLTLTHYILYNLCRYWSFI